MDKLTPTARLTLDALKDGPGNVHELYERTGRSRSATDKALGELAKANLILKVDDDGDPADGAPARWQFADPASAAAEPTQSEPNNNVTTPPDAGQSDTGENTATDVEATDPAAPGRSADPASDPEQADQAPKGPPTDETHTAEPANDGQPDGEPRPDGDTQPDGEVRAVAEQPKLCRGCQAQMPKICECCWQKTPAFCGNCRKNMPQVRRGEPGEPVILSNGLRKLRPGELEDLIRKVLRDHPLPAFAGIVGWTGGRVAIHLPGRSPSAINNALEKFTMTGECELIGDKPMRYQLKDTGQTEGTSGVGRSAEAASDNGQRQADESEADQHEPGQPEAGQPAPGRATEPPGSEHDAVIA
jgi:hypothetical protein